MVSSLACLVFWGVPTLRCRETNVAGKIIEPNSRDLPMPSFPWQSRVPNRNEWSINMSTYFLQPDFFDHMTRFISRTWIGEFFHKTELNYKGDLSKNMWIWQFKSTTLGFDQQRLQKADVTRESDDFHHPKSRCHHRKPWDLTKVRCDLKRQIWLDPWTTAEM